MTALLLALILVCQAPLDSMAEAEHLYSTWDMLEVDTVASAWLIRRFIDTQAEFRFFKKGDIITEGVAFDTPDALFQRSANQSTFESLLTTYKIADRVLLEIGEIIYDIEINYWSERLRKESEEISRQINEIIKQAERPDECLDKGFPIFDRLYKELSN